MGTVDQTMPALFAHASSDTLMPLAQLGAGPDGTAVLARRGERLVAVHTPSFAVDSPRWTALELRARTIGAIQHPAMRAVLAIERVPPAIVLDGDSFPPIAELIEQGIELPRVVELVGALAGALAAAHHAGVFHGGIHPWSVWVGPQDRVRVELVQLATRTIHHPWVDKCLAPETLLPSAAALVGLSSAAGDAAADVYSVGVLLELFASGRNATVELLDLIREATSIDPEARPSMIELARRLTVNGRAPAPDVQTTQIAVGTRIGRYELVRQLGLGAMGEVWEARDRAGPNVALKLLRPEIASNAELLRRFRKEARVLARVGSPFIANFLDLNHDRGLHYLVLELVPGGSVAAALRRQNRFPERFALAIVSDACRALGEPHRLGIVHRDLKPDNMMFVRPGLELETPHEAVASRTPSTGFAGRGAGSPWNQQVIKLGDFGIARATENLPEGVTREGQVLGTPEYMAPEQCHGEPVTPATDVYALGCCLFAMIAGRPPFAAANESESGSGDSMRVLIRHINDEPPRLDAVNREASPAIADLVARCLVKDPKQRLADATELLVAIEQLCGNSASMISAHPAPPIVRASAVQTYELSWELGASPAQLWPFVSNTEKMNRATGLAPVHFEVSSMERAGESATVGNQRVAGIALRWREHPYEWIEGSRHVVLRVFERGVLRWYIADVTLERLPSGGTRLRNTIKLEPRGLLARVLSKWEIGVKYKRRLDKVYARLDRLLAAGSPGAHPEIDPIDPEVTVSSTTRTRIDNHCERLRQLDLDDRAVDALGAFLKSASDQDVARIRPLALAARFDVREEPMIAACLHATRLGMLAMVWDVICPSCKIPSTIEESLEKIEEHARCKTCNVGFEVDFSRAIELAFRAAPDIRAVETRTYCIGSPAHFPHVVAQLRLGSGERLAVQLALPPGYYLVRSPQVTRVHELRVVAQGGIRRHDVQLGELEPVALLGAGDQLLTIVNGGEREVLVRVERAGDRGLALTAARAMATAAFRELFPDQQLGRGRLMAITQATLVIAQIDNATALFHELGDSKAFPVAARFFELVGRLARDHGGTLVKTFGGIAIAAFERPGPAVAAALEIQSTVDEDALTSGLSCRIAVHRGPMMALTQAGRLDYFGEHVELALEAAAATPPAAISLTQAVCGEAEIAERVLTLPDRVGMVMLGSGWMWQLQAKRSHARALPPAAGDTTQTKVV